MQIFDVVVIGGGVAGAAAALAAARSDARVALVRRGPGATALAAGGWNGAPPAELRVALARAGLDLVESLGALPHPDGALVRCDVAGASHARASVSGPESGTDDARRTIVCGIAGLPSFSARALAALWAAAADLPDDLLEPVTLTLPDTPASGWSPVALAALLEREPHLLGAAISRAAGERGAERAIVPAVLGLDEHARTHDRVQQSAGVVVGEALGIAPSAPGWRLDRALLGALAHAGVQVITGRVAGAVVHAGALQSIAVADAADLDVAARSFVLATGKFLGGGITAEAEFEDSAIGCDVAIERFARTIDDPSASLMLTDPVRTEPQPVLSVGVRADVEGRPLAPSDGVSMTNVFIAGSVRAGVETAALGLGGAAHDGWRAGTRAAALASQRSAMEP